MLSGLDASSLSRMDLNFLANFELKLAIVDKLEPAEATESLPLESYFTDFGQEAQVKTRFCNASRDIMLKKSEVYSRWSELGLG